MNNYDTKKKIVEAGNSEVFKEWQKVALISQEEFLEALKWVCEDDGNSRGQLTREIGLVVTKDMQNKLLGEVEPKYGGDYDINNLKGRIVMLERRYTETLKEGFEKIDGEWFYSKGAYDFASFFDLETGKIWNHRGRFVYRLNCRDKV